MGNSSNAGLVAFFFLEDLTDLVLELLTKAFGVVSSFVHTSHGFVLELVHIFLWLVGVEVLLRFVILVFGGICKFVCILIDPVSCFMEIFLKGIHETQLL